MEKKTLYMVVFDPFKITADIQAIFDTAEQAQAYIDRFKSSFEYEVQIVERELNPEFRTDKTKNPYSFIMSYTGEVYDFYRTWDIEESNAAFSSGYEYKYHNSDSMEKVELFLHVLADSEKKARAQAKSIHDGLIASGDWEKKWLEHQATLELA